MVQFKSFTSGAAPAAPQVNPLVAALLRKALSDQPIRHPAQGFDKLGKAALAAFLQRKEKTEREEREERKGETLQEAFAKLEGIPEQAIPSSLADVTGGLDLGGSTGFNVPAVPGDRQAFINALIGNPDTANLGIQLSLQGDERRFQTSERLGGETFRAEQAGLARDAAVTKAGSQREFTTGEREAGQEFTAKQSKVAQKAAADLAEAKRAFDLKQPTSVAGKQISDRRKLTLQFGVGSLEVKNFDALISSGAAVNVQLPDKTIVLGRKRKNGKVELQNADGTFRLAPPKSQIIGLNVQASTLEELNPLEPLPPSDTSGSGGVDLAEATGGSGFFKGIGNTITDAFGLGLASPQAEVATNALKTLALQTTINLADEITGKPSKFIQEKILAIQASAGSIFQGDARSKIKFQEVRDIVADQRNDAKSLVELGGLKRPDQARAIVKLQKLNRLLAEYDSILENFGGGSNAPTQEDIEFTAEQEGVSVEEVKRQLGLK